jgi:ribosome biogenesis protein MAK21
MKAVVLQELSAIVFRRLSSGKLPLLHPHLTYYALVTLNQIVFSSTSQEVHVAREFVSFYFEVFKEILELSEDEHDVFCNEKRIKNMEEGARKRRRKSGRNRIKIEIETTHSKLVVAALTGLRRALPFARIEHDERCALPNN